MNRTRLAAASAALLCLASGAARAQAAAPGSTATIPEKVAPSTDLNTRPGTLSDKLGASDGVIKPSGDVDPAMHREAPQTGTTPVIKPKDVPPGQTGSGQGGLY